MSPGQVHQNFYLSCYQITCPCQGKIDYQWIFHLSAGHWVKIYACPAWNSTCPGHQDKWFIYPWKYRLWNLRIDCRVFIILIWLPWHSPCWRSSWSWYHWPCPRGWCCRRVQRSGWCVGPACDARSQTPHPGDPIIHSHTHDN